MQSRIFKNIVFPIWQMVKHRHVLEKLQELEQTQYCTKDEIDTFQLNKIKALLQHVYNNVPFYQELFDKYHLRVKDIKTLEDMNKIPIITKENVRDNFRLFLADGCRRGYTIHSTSGSTGKPMTFYVDLISRDYWQATRWRGRRWWGLDIGDKEALMWGRQLWSSKRHIISASISTKIIHANELKLSVFNLTEQSMSDYYTRLMIFKPKILYGYVSGIYALAKFYREENIDASALNLKIISTTAEILHDFQRDLIESVFGTHVVNEYGSAEGGIHAFECPDGGLHLSSESNYFEFINKSNKKAKPGEMGEVIITNLHNYILPLIRYQLEDLVIVSAKKCSCGRSLPIIDKIIGRDQDMVRLRNGKLVHPEFFDYIHRSIVYRGIEGIKDFRVTQETLDDFLFEIVRAPTFKAAALEYITLEINNNFGKGINVRFKIVDEIKREKSGKLRYFVSCLQNT